MNTFTGDAAGWIYQQDYTTFLAVLGWMTAGLIAWGYAATAKDARVVSWKWFALASLSLAADGGVDLLRMMLPGIRPPGLDALLRLAAYGCLLEVARRSVVNRGWARISGVVSAFVPTAALGLLFFVPKVSPVPEVLLAFVGGSAAAVMLTLAVEKGNRPLLGVAAALLIIGPVELLRAQGDITIDRLNGIPVTVEGFVVALCACVLAWVAAGSLWLHSVLRRRVGLFAGRPESSSPLASIVLPAVIAVTLSAGFFVVNRSAARARGILEQGYLNRVRTAALAVDATLLADVLTGQPLDTGSPVVTKIRRQLQAVRAVGEELSRVYLWNIVDGRIVLPRVWVVGQTPLGDEPAVVRVGVRALPTAGASHLFGPVGTSDFAVLVVSAPVVDYEEGRQLAWLSVDIPARAWLTAQASARLQTIALVGLFASLVVFFLAHVVLREYEAELLVDKERAEAADRAKEEFLAVMSHEIRTPMQSVLGYGELLARTPLNEAQSGYLDAIRSQGRTLLRIVQDILDFAVLRKSSYTLKRETVFLHRLIESTYESIKPLAARKHLGTGLRIAPEVPEVVLGDAVRIEQIVLNLLGNAVKFTDDGSVHLDARLERSESRGGGSVYWVLITVTDTGMGIRHADVRKLFEPFTRLSPKEATPREGAGLGLAIVKRLCQLMGGRIDIESEWGRGTRIFVRLPLPGVAEPEADAFVREAAVEAAPLDGSGPNLGTLLPLRVLVAEDNPYIRMLMIEYLRSIGYEPRSVGSGREVVERWRDFDLIIMDLRMPGMDGVTASEHVRKAAADPDVPWIIGVSATLSEAEIQRAMEAGMNDFLGKPFFVQSLIEAIKATPFYAHRESAPAPEPVPDGAAAVPADPLQCSGVAPAAGGEPGPDPVPAAPGPPPTAMSWMPDLAANGGSEIVKQAVAEIPGILDEVSAALESGDFETAAERAHYLKNTILALRIEPMVEPCRAVFERATRRESDAARTSLGELRSAFAGWQASRGQIG